MPTYRNRDSGAVEFVKPGADDPYENDPAYGRTSDPDPDPDPLNDSDETDDEADDETGEKPRTRRRTPKA